jgi:hypothetical protein
MLAEHLVYSTALAIIVGMLCLRYTGRDVSWIIIVLAWAPDTDLFLSIILRIFRIRYRFDGYTIIHGTFHNIAAMVVFAMIIVIILHPFGIRYLEAFIMAVIGFGAHLIEDALVYPHGYMFLWPLSQERVGLGWLLASANEETYKTDFFHIANTEVLFIGFVLLLIAVLIRTRFEGSGWIRWYMPEKVYRRYFAGNNKS